MATHMYETEYGPQKMYSIVVVLTDGLVVVEGVNGKIMRFTGLKDLILPVRHTKVLPESTASTYSRNSL